jgi:chemotaxis protein methyltransferase CheR
MYPSGMTGTTDIDVILCRNVLIYFDQETIRHVARQLFASLRIGGWLITGPSDPPLWDYAPFQTHVTAGGVLYQRGERAAIQFPVPPLKAAPPPIMPVSTIVASVAEVAAPAYAETDYTPRSVAESPVGIPDYISRIRALADRGESQQAETAATAALRTYPLCPELHYLHAIVFMELGRYDDAVASLRRVIYLDPTLAMAHFTLGSMLGRLGATAEARHTYQNVVALCLGRPKDEVLPLSDGELTANLAAAAQAQLTLIGGTMEKAR